MDAEDLHAELQAAYDEILKLREATTQYGVDGFIRRAELAEERARRLEDKLEQQSADSERLRARLEATEDSLHRQEHDLQEALRAKEDGEEVVLRLRRDLERAMEELQRERSRATEASMAGARAAQDRSFHSSELDKAMAENAELHEELKSLEEDVQAYRTAIVELKADAEALEEERGDLESGLDAANGRIAELSGELGAAHEALSGSQARVEEVRSAVTSLQAQMRAAADHAAAEREGALARAAAAERRAEESERGLRDNSRVHALETELARASSAAAEAGAARDESARLLEAVSTQLAGALEDVRELSEGREDAIEAAVRGERAEVRALGGQLEDARAAARAQGELAEALAAQRASLEEELEAAGLRMRAYEAGYGLVEAAGEQAALQEAVRRRDGDIARLTGAAGLQLDAYDALLEAATRLAVEAGYPPSVDVLSLFPRGELDVAAQGRAERLSAAAEELRRQNEALEEQRARLLRSLRVNAEHSGERAHRYYGLSGEQLLAVNEFAEGLREGVLELPLNDRSLQLAAELRSAGNEVQDLRAQLYAARAALPHAAAAGAVADATAATRTAAGEARAQVAAEAAAQRAHLGQMLDRVLGAVSAAAASASAGPRAAPPFSPEDVAALATLARALLAGGEAPPGSGTLAPAPHAPSPGGTEAALVGLRDVLKGVVTENRALRRELQEAVEGTRGSGAPLWGARIASSSDASPPSLSWLPAHLRMRASADTRITGAQAALRAALDASAGMDAGGVEAVYAALRVLLLSHEELLGVAVGEHGAAEALRAAAAESAAASSRLRGELDLLRDEHALVISAASSSAASHGTGRGRVSEAGPLATPEDLRAALLESEAALGRTLELLLRRDGEGAALEAALSAARERLALLSSRLHELSARSGQKVDALSQALEEAEARAGEAEAALAGSRTQAALLQAALAALAPARDDDAADPGSPTAVQRLLRENTRRLAELEVAQPQLARRHNLLAAELAATRALLRAGEAGELEARAHAGARILYLETWKAGAEARGLGPNLRLLSPQGPPPQGEGGEGNGTLPVDPPHRPPGGELCVVPAEAYDALAGRYAELSAQAAELAASEARCSARYESSPASSRGALDAGAAAARAALLQAELEEARAATAAAKGEAADARALLLQLQAEGGGAPTTPATAPAVTVGGRSLPLSTASRTQLLGIAIQLRGEVGDLEVAAAGQAVRLTLQAGRVAELEAEAGLLAARASAAEGALPPLRSALGAAEETRRRAEVEHAASLPGAEAARLRAALAAVRERAEALGVEVRRARGVADLAHAQAATATALVADREAEVSGLRAAALELASRSDEDAVIGSLQSALLAGKAEFSALVRRFHACYATLKAARIAAASLEVVLDEERVSAAAAAERAQAREAALRTRLGDLDAEVSALRRTGMDAPTAMGLRESVQALSAACAAAEARAAAAGRVAANAAADTAEARGVADSLRVQVRDLTAVATAAAAPSIAADGSSGPAAPVAASATPPHITQRINELHEALRAAGLAAQRAAREVQVANEEARSSRSLVAARELELRGVEEALLRATAPPQHPDPAEPVQNAASPSPVPSPAPSPTPSSATAPEISALRSRFEAEKRGLHAAAAATVEALRSLLHAKDGALRIAEDRIDSQRRELEAARVAGEASRAAGEREARAEAEGLRRALAQATGGSSGDGGGEGGGPLQEWRAALIQRASELDAAVTSRDTQLAEARRQLATLQAEADAARRTAAAARAQSERLQAEAEALRLEADASRAGAEAAATEAERAVAGASEELRNREARIRSLSASLVALKEEFVRAEMAHATAMAQVGVLPTTPHPQPQQQQQQQQQQAEATTTAAPPPAHEAPGTPAPVARLRDELASLRASLAAGALERGKLSEALKVATAEAEAARAAAGISEAAAAALRKELLRSRNALRQQLAGGGDGEPEPGGGGGTANAVLAAKLRRAEAQLEELRAKGAAKPLPPATATTTTTTTASDEEQLKKLRRRVEVLTTQLAAATAAADSARAGTATITAALAKLKADRDALDRRHGALQKHYTALDAAAAAALPALSSTAVLKARISELESTQMGGGGLLAHQAGLLQDGALGADQTPPAAPGEGAAADGAAAVQLRAENAHLLDTVREFAAFRALVDALMHKGGPLGTDSAAATARRKGEADSLRVTTAGTQQAPSQSGAAAAAQQAAQQQRTVQSLEDMVNRLRTLTDKQRREIERLRAGAKAQLQQQQSAEEEQLAAAQSQPGVQQQEPATATQRATDIAALHATREDVARLRGRLRELEEHTLIQEQLREQVAALQAELQRARASPLGSSTTSAVSSVPPAAPHVARHQLPVIPPREGDASDSSLAALPDDAGALHSALAHLQRENEALRAELGAFDAEFFDEIEDLKYKYAEASKKCHAFDEYVRLYPPVGGAS